MASIMAGSFLAGIGGACLSLYYPGVWTERISSGQGLMAVALVIFAPLESDSMPVGFYAIWGRSGARACLSISRYRFVLLCIQRSALHSYFVDYGDYLLA